MVKVDRRAMLNAYVSPNYQKRPKLGPGLEETSSNRDLKELIDHHSDEIGFFQENALSQPSISNHVLV